MYLRSTLILALLFLLTLCGKAQEVEEARLAFDHSHAAWTTVLASVVESRDVDYKVLKKKRGALDAYLKSLEAVDAEDFAEWKRAERYAFWINAYNGYTLQLVIDHYPLKSIRDVGDEKIGTWDRRFISLQHLLAGPTKDSAQFEAGLSLNQLEHEILRKQFEDARVHAAVNCASKGCPPLRAAAFTAKGLDDQLDDVVTTWLADEASNRFDAQERAAELSSIFTWFEADFVRDGESVAGWLAKYAPPQHRKWLAQGEIALSYLDYDWALNDVAPHLEHDQGR